MNTPDKENSLSVEDLEVGMKIKFLDSESRAEVISRDGIYAILQFTQVDGRPANHSVPYSGSAAKFVLEK